MIKLLGEGQMSSVVHCVCKQSNTAVAVKMYHKDRMNTLNVKQVPEMHNRFHMEYIGFGFARADNEMHFEGKFVLEPLVRIQ